MGRKMVCAVSGWPAAMGSTITVLPRSFEQRPLMATAASFFPTVRVKSRPNLLSGDPSSVSAPLLGMISNLTFLTPDAGGGGGGTDGSTAIGVAATRGIRFAEGSALAV